MLSDGAAQSWTHPDHIGNRNSCTVSGTNLHLVSRCYSFVIPQLIRNLNFTGSSASYFWSLAFSRFSAASSTVQSIVDDRRLISDPSLCGRHTIRKICATFQTQLTTTNHATTWIPTRLRDGTRSVGIVACIRRTLKVGDQPGTKAVSVMSMN